jgi:hypothetical protein
LMNKRSWPTKGASSGPMGEATILSFAPSQGQAKDSRLFRESLQLA